MAEIIRPGPPAIEPDQAPNGLVIRCYAVPEEQLLFEQRLTPGADLETMATEAGDIANAEEGSVCLVCYDGDSGARLSPEDWLLGIILAGPIE